VYIAGIWGGMPLRGWTGHDASAVLLKDGVVVAGIEEERLRRVKHTRSIPANALAFCLAQAQITADDVDRFAIGLSPRAVAGIEPSVIVGALAGRPIDPRRLCFVEHHVAHAYSAYAGSGFEESLVLTLDGRGEDAAGLVGIARRSHFERLREIAISDSLGHLYLLVTNFLGYRLFDEYKVMGLAPYGDPARYRSVLEELYVLLDDGRYKLRLDRQKVLWDICSRRRRDEPLTQVHSALAAAAQEALETIVLHVVEHFRGQTGMRRLCFAGGVAHNCSLNGRIAASGLFDEIFVHPAAHDAGTALGAAAFVHLSDGAASSTTPLRDVYWGPALAGSQPLEATLRQWQGLVAIWRSSDVCRESAALLAGGAVIGWVQGRSEFGPRALGNRSILADPRPAANKDRINAMVKKREGYRPFAPSVVAERAVEFFELPPSDCNLDHMLFVVPVRPSKRELLGAVTHVDGTARIQTVRQETNPRYWELLHAFEERTGLPILLNTSFNNNWEPIVDSIEDALACFLTTDLDYLVVEDWVIQKRDIGRSSWLTMTLSLAAHVTLAASGGAPEYTCRFEEPGSLTRRGPACASVAISRAAHDVLRQANGRETLGALVDAAGAPVDHVAEEIWKLWERRLVVLRPSLATPS
jgi:carbamoyltransferase